MTNNPQDSLNRDKPVASRNEKGLFLPGNTIGATGGRPKRKTLTELIHAKLDETPGGWEAIVKTAISKALTDKEVLRTLWQYTDGMPKQGVDITTGGKPFPLLGDLTNGLSSNDSCKKAPKAE